VVVYRDIQHPFHPAIAAFASTAAAPGEARRRSQRSADLRGNFRSAIRGSRPQGSGQTARSLSLGPTVDSNPRALWMTSSCRARPTAGRGHSLRSRCAPILRPRRRS
jgi:hypothetical protein